MTRISAPLGPKGQVVIPKPVRDELGLKPGDTLYFSTHEGHAHLEKGDARAIWAELFAAFPKQHFPAEHDWDKEFEESYEE